jgi:type II secretory pathway pseudopilin PulG
MRLRIAPAKLRSTSGFTLAEVLASLLFMALVIPVAMEGISVASRSGELAARKYEAALVAERVLQEAIVTTNWMQGQSQRVRQGKLEIECTLKSERWPEDPNQTAIQLLTVEAIFQSQGREYKVVLSTLVDESTPLQGTNGFGRITTGSSL